MSLSAKDPTLLDALPRCAFHTPVGLGMFDTAQFKLSTTDTLVIGKLQASIKQLGPEHL